MSGANDAARSEAANAFVAAGPRLNLLALRAANLRATAAFYETLGFTFTSERHGAGPEHLASVRSGSCLWNLELYPATCAVDTQAVRLGFDVSDLDAMLARLIASGGQVVTKPSREHARSPRRRLRSRRTASGTG
ncbi:MAG: VOC family protein [Pirellulales bacterium]